MSSYCRITGRSRGLPKPNYFPLLPPISPADAKRLFCRITGKSHGLPTHHYIPVLIGFTKHSKSPCHITANADIAGTEHLVAVGIKHTILKNYRYVFPALETNADLLQILESKSSSEINNNNKYVYTVNESRCSLVFPGRLEAAVRDGDVRDIMLAAHTDTLLLKLRKGGSVEVDVRDMSFDENEELYEGEGPSQEVLQRRRKRTKNRGDNNDWRRKIFEDKERQADDEEERISEIKSKRIKVKLDVIKETPHLCIWNNVREGLIELHGDAKFDQTMGNTILQFGQQDLQNFINVPGSPIISTLPQCLKVQTENVDLSISVPGIIKQPIATGEQVIGFPIGAVIVPFQPLIAVTDEVIDNEIQKFNISKDKLQKILIKQLNLRTQFGNILPLIQHVPDLAKQMETLIGTQNETKTEFGVKLNLENGPTYIPGQFFETPSGPVFVPGNVIETPMGPSFVAGFSVNTPDGVKFLPGRIVKDHKQPVFVSGQMAVTREGEKFVQGQMVCTKEGPKFIPGQTVITSEGVKFVPGQVIQNTDDHPCRFIPGQTIMTPEGPQFVSGQFTQSDEETIFVPGQAVLNENYNWEFIPGKNMKTDDGACIFVPGKEVVNELGTSQFVPGRMIIENGEVERFLPGLTVDDGKGNMRFVPGMQLETPEGVKFVEGMMIKNENSISFAVGKVSSTGPDGNTIEFSSAKSSEDIVMHDILSNFGMCFGSTPAADSINETEVFGHMIQSAQGVEFFPGDSSGLPAGKVIPGKLIKGKEMRFIPGTMIDNKFIPGQFVTTGSEEKFIPGQVIETNEGPKFVPGQVLHTKSGPKFVPGQMMETEDGPKFIPGQIIETKSGPTFIPGQVIYTEEEGSRFVPGQVVDTIEGPRFVPGRVVETGDHVTFIPGQIVETDDGLKFIAPDLEDDLEGGYQFTVQGFEVAQEELKMIQRNSIPHACFSGEMAIDSQTLQQLAQAGMALGRQLPVDVPVVNIKSMPTTEAACKIANNLDVDALYSVKLSHILSSLQQVCHSNVALTDEEIGDENLLKVVNLAMECENNADLLETLGNALEKIIKQDSGNTLKTIDNLHMISIELATKVRDKKPNKVLILKNLVKGNIEEQNEVVDVLVAILSDHQPAICAAFEQMCQQNPEFVDKVLENFALMMKNVLDTNDESSAVEALQQAIVKTVTETSQSRIQQAQYHNKEVENLQVPVQEKNDMQLLVKACKMAEKLQVEATCSVKLGQILSNLEQARQCNVTLTSEEVENEDLLKLLNLALKSDSNSDLLETLEGALEKVVKQDPGNELEIINCLQTSSAKMATKAHKKQIEIKACQIAKKLQVDANSSAKIGQTLSALQKIRRSNVPLTREEVGNEDLFSLLNLALKCNTNADLLETLGGALEDIIQRDPHNKLEVINCLQRSASKMAIKACNKKVKSKGNLQLLMKACQIADKLQMDATCSAKLGYILSNLENVGQSNVALTNEEVGDENVFRLLNLAMSCDTDSDLLETLSGALEDVIKQNPGCEQDVINYLQTSIAKVATTARNMQLDNKACQIANELQVDAPSSVELRQILSNLEQIRQCNVALTSEEVGDEELLKLLNLVMNCDTNSDLLEILGGALEDFVEQDPSNKLKVIDRLQRSTSKMAIRALNKKSKSKGDVQLLVKASQIADKLQVDASCSAKLGHIISNLENICQSNVTLASEEVGDEKVFRLLNLAMNCNADFDLLETMGSVLVDIIKQDSDDAPDVIDCLQTSVAKVATKARNKQLKNKTCQIANKLKVDETNSVKLGQILSSLEQIRQCNVALTSEEVGNEDLLKLLNLAIECDTNSDLLETLGGALEEVIKQDYVNKLEVIDCLQTSTAKMVVKALNKKNKAKCNLQLLTKASQIADNLQMDVSCSAKLGHILSNLENVCQSNVALTTEEISNEKVSKLLTLAMNCNTDSELLETLGNALEDIIKQDSGDALDIINCLQTSVAKVATKSQNKQLKNKACQISNKLKVDETNSVKLSQILSNLEQIRQCNVMLTSEEVGDEDLLNLLNLAMNCDNNFDLLETLGGALEDVIKQDSRNKVKVIDCLQTSTAKMAVKALNKKNKGKGNLQLLTKASQIADKLQMDVSCSAKVGHILSNLESVCQSNVALTTDEIGDEKVSKLLNLAMNCNTDSDLLETLGSALEDIIKQDFGNALDVIECLQTSAAKVATTALNKQLENKTCQIANRLQVDETNSVKLGQILSNLEQIRQCNVALTSEEVGNEDLLMLLNLAMKCDNNSVLLETLGGALEDIIKRDPTKKPEVIECLQSSTAKMAIKACEKKSKENDNLQLLNKVNQIADKLQVNIKYSVKLGHILSNLEQVRQFNVAFTSEEVGDERILGLLNLAIKCNTNADLLETLGGALEDIIEKESGNKEDVIDCLQTSTAKIAIKARNKKAKTNGDLPLLTKACQIANKLQVDAACSVKLGQILSNLEQFRQVNIPLTSKEVSNESVLKLLNLALKCDTNSDLLEKLSSALEDVIRKGPGNKLEIIDCLQTSTAKMVDKACEKQLGIKVSQISDKLQVDETCSHKLGQILSNLQQINLSDMALASEKLVDRNLLKLLNIAKKCDTTSNLLETLGDALENIIKEDSGNKLEFIDSLHTSTSKLVSKTRHKKIPGNDDLQLLVKACQVADELQVDPTSLVKLGHILSNMSEICQANVELTNKEVGDKNLLKMLNMAKKCETSSDILTTLADALGDVIKQDAGKTLEVIDHLKASAAKMVVKARKKDGKESNDLQILTKACLVANKLHVDSTSSIKLGHILSNLQEVGLSNVALTNEEVGDENLLKLLNLIMECDTDCDMLENLAVALGDVIKQDSRNAVEMIDCLQASAVKMVVKARNKKTESKSEVRMLVKACQIADKLEVDAASSVKLGNILSNLEKVCQSNVQLTSEEVGNKDVLRLLNLAMKCDTNSDLLEKLGSALEDAIKKDPDNKLEVIDSLQTCTAKMAMKANNKQLEIQASQIADKLQVDSTCSVKLGNILSNLQEVCLANVPLTSKEVGDENLLKLLNLAQNVDINSDLLETLADALGDVIKQDSGNALEVINHLQSSTAKMAIKAHNKKSKSKCDVQLLVKASQMADNLQVTPACSVKLGQILCNFEKASQCNVTLTNEEVGDENVSRLLNLAMQCNTNSDLLEKLGSALEDVIKKDLNNKLEVIDSLLTCTAEMTINGGNKQLEIQASRVADKLQVDSVCSVKLGNILSNLREVCLSNVPLSSEVVGNENLFKLLNLAQNCDINSDLLETLANALEDVIKQDSGNVLEVIDCLQSSAAKMIIKAHNKTSKSKSDVQLLVKASQMADKSKVDVTYSAKLGQILSNLEKARHANISLTSDEVGDENVSRLLNLAMQCETNSDLLEKLSCALEDVIKKDPNNKHEIIDSLLTCTAEMVMKGGNKQLEIQACRVADKLQVDSACSVKLSNILSSLREVCLSNVPLSNEEIGNENLFKLLNLAQNCDMNSDLLETLADALEDVIKINPGNPVELIDCLQSSAAKMVTKAHNKISKSKGDVQLFVKASQMADELQVDPACSFELGQILSNLEKARQSNIILTNEEIGDENVSWLLNLAMQCNNNSDLLEKLGSAVKDVIKKDPNNKLEIIDSLQTCTAEMAIKANKKQLKMQACQVANRLQVDSKCSVKLGNILCNLQEVCLSSVALTKEEVGNENLLTLLNLAQNCDINSNLLENLTNVLEDVIKKDPGNAVELIDCLQTSAAKMATKAHNKISKSKGDMHLLVKASQIADKLQVDLTCSVKLGDILSNLEKASKSNVKLTSEEVGDENVLKLLNIALKCDTNADLLQTLTDALVNVIKADSGNALDVIDSLQKSTAKVADKAHNKQLEIKSGEIADKLQMDETCSAQLGHILSNLQQIRQSNVALTNKEVSDEKLMSLMNLAMNCDSDSDLMETLADALEDFIKQDSGNKRDVIDCLQKSTTKIATIVRNKQVKEKCDLQRRVKAHQIANKLQVNETCLAKLGNILSNLQQVCQSNVPLTSEEIGDEKILNLLNLAMKCDTNSNALETLAEALEDIIKQDSGNPQNVIDSLQRSTAKVANKARNKEAKANDDLQLLVKGCQIADKLKVDATSSVKLCNILSNLQQVHQSNVALTREEVGDKELFKLLNLAMNSDTNSDLLETLAEALENVIKRDSGNKLDVIDCLQASTAKMATKARIKKPNKVLLLRNMINGCSLEEKNIVMDKLIAMLNDHETVVGVAFQHMCQQDPKFVDKVLENAAAMLKTIIDPENETAAMETLHRAIIKTVTECSESKVHQAMHSRGGDDFSLLVKDAISLAKALGMGEAVSILNEVLKDRNSVQVLAKDTIVMEVLKRLTVMRQLAESRPNLVKALKDLHSDPYAARSDPRLRELVRESAMLMVIPEESLIKSSHDIPHSIMFSDNCLVVEDFMAKTRQCGKTFLILKKGIQAVIPREAAKDVLTGRVPYTMLDENGIHYFKPLHVFNALKLPRVAANRFHNYTYIHPALLDDDSSSGTRGSSISTEDLRKNLPNGHGHNPSHHEVNFRVRIGLK